MRDIHYDYFPPAWESLIESFDYSILLNHEFGDYQGDLFFLLEDAAPTYYRVGFLVFGYGSCSGCDSLQACANKEEVIELRDKLHTEIHWEDSPKEMLTFLHNRDAPLYWYGAKTNWEEFLGKARRVLSQ